MGIRNRVNAGIRRLDEKRPGWYTTINPDDIHEPFDVLSIVFNNDANGLRFFGVKNEILTKRRGFGVFSTEEPRRTKEIDSLVDTWKRRIAALQASAEQEKGPESF